jgi:Ca2+-binding RTX toxin-like protein
MLSVTLVEGVLSVEGTDGDDVITFSVDNTVPETPALVVSVNGESTSNDLALVTSIQVDAGNGHDSVTLGDVAIPATLLGGNGKDSLSGGAGDDVIEGGNGKDLLAGNGGNDALNGGNGKDNLSGGDGDDSLVGGRGKDVLDGGEGTNVLEEEKQSKRKGPKKDKDGSPIDDDGTDDHRKQKGKGHAKKKGKGHR